MGAGGEGGTRELATLKTVSRREVGVRACVYAVDVETGLRELLFEGILSAWGVCAYLWLVNDGLVVSRGGGFGRVATMFRTRWLLERNGFWND